MKAIVDLCRRATDRRARTNSHLQTIEQRIAQLHFVVNEQGRTIMATVEALKQNILDIKGLVSQLLELISKRDETNAQLKQQLTDALNKANIADEERNSLQRSFDEAFVAIEDAENELRAKVPGVPPVGGTGLAQSYDSRSAFDAAWSAYGGPETITLDGQEVKAGSPPPINYFSHSATSSVDTFGPAD